MMNLSAKLRRRLLVVTALFALFLLTGFVILPPLIRTRLERELSATLGRQVTVERVRLNPCLWSLTIENFTVRERDGTTPFVGWRRLHVDLDLLSSLLGEWVLSEVTLEGLHVRGQINADRSLNVSDLIAKFTPAAPAPAPTAKPPRPVRVVQLQVTDARVAFNDLSRAKPFTTTLAPLTIDVRELRSVGGPGAIARVAFTTEAGEKLTWAGSLQLAPFQTTGELKLEQIALTKYAPYYADLLRAELSRGQLSLSFRHQLTLDPAQRKVVVTGGAIQLRDLQVRMPNETEAAIELPSLEALGLEADVDASKGRLASLTLSGGHLRVRRDQDGAFNLLSLLRPMPTSPSPAPAGSPATKPTAPDFTVLELALKDFQLELTDLAAPRPAQFALQHLNVALKQVTLAPQATMPVQLDFDWAPRGRMQIDGQVSLNPTQAELKVVTNGLDLLPFSPYLEQFVNARLTQGALHTQLVARASLSPEQTPAVTVSGDLALEKIGLVDSAQSEDLAGIERLALRGLQLTTTPELSLQLGELTLTAPHARTIVHPDHSINLLQLVRPAPAATGAAPSAPVASTSSPAAPSKPSPRIEIAQVTISGGEFSFSDRSVEPRVNLAVKQFGGQLTGLSSTNPAKAEVKLQASVDESGPVAITGKLDLLRAQPTVDLKLDLNHVDLVPLSPYSGKFAGYELARGQLKLDVGLEVANGKIDAKNVLTLNQFTFGHAVESPEATKLPVRLGVALLKDLDGKIVIDVPVQGRTDDPDFRIGRVVLRVIVNLLTKAAVSPFSLLGAAFGGGEELAYQEFAPGSAELLPTEIGKLEKLTQALAQRPGLSVALEGNYDAAADTYALKRSKVAEKVRRTIWEQQHLRNSNIPPPEQLAITPEENAAMVKQLFDAAFPPGTQFGTPLPAPPPVLAPPPPPAGFFRRAFAALTLSAQRAERQTAKENARRQSEHAQAVANATAAGLPLEAMFGRLAEATVIEDHDLRALADARAQRVRTYLSDVGKISLERLFLAKDNSAGDTTKTGKGPRVSLQLQ